jgi:hypothetical protein
MNVSAAVPGPSEVRSMKRHPGPDPGSIFFRWALASKNRWMPDQVRHDEMRGYSNQSTPAVGRVYNRRMGLISLHHQSGGKPPSARTGTARVSIFASTLFHQKGAGRRFIWSRRPPRSFLQHLSSGYSALAICLSWISCIMWQMHQACRTPMRDFLAGSSRCTSKEDQAHLSRGAPICLGVYGGSAGARPAHLTWELTRCRAKGIGQSRPCRFNNLITLLAHA